MGSHSAEVVLYCPHSTTRCLLRLHPWPHQQMELLDTHHSKHLWLTIASRRSNPHSLYPCLDWTWQHHRPMLSRMASQCPQSAIFCLPHNTTQSMTASQLLKYAGMWDCYFIMWLLHGSLVSLLHMQYRVIGAGRKTIDVWMLSESMQCYIYIYIYHADAPLLW